MDLSLLMIRGDLLPGYKPSKKCPSQPIIPRHSGKICLNHQLWYSSGIAVPTTPKYGIAPAMHPTNPPLPCASDGRAPASNG